MKTFHQLTLLTAAVSVLVVPPRGAMAESAVANDQSDSARSEITDWFFAEKQDLPVRPLEELVDEVSPAVVMVSTPSGNGSGFFINREGYLITNAHVIEGENQGNITVTVYNKTPHGLDQVDYVKVRIIAYYGQFDLALLKINPPEPTEFSWVPLGDSSQVNQGERVFAVGSPLGLERTVSEGIISVPRMAMENYGVYAQTTAPVNPGNSGGPLFNLKGEVVGVNSLSASGQDGIGMAILSDMVKVFLRNREAFVFNEKNSANGYRYLPPGVKDSVAEDTDLAPIQLAAPKIMKVGTRTHSFRSADLDNDSRMDLVAANNEKGVIELFYQRTKEELHELAINPAYSDRERPVIENAPFFRDKIVISDEIYDIQPIDFDGDGLVDIAYTSQRTGIHVIFQTAKGKWDTNLRYDKYKPYPHEGTIRVADMNGDNKKDLCVMVSEGRVAIFTSGEGRQLGIPKLVGVASPASQWLQTADVNKDGRTDLLFLSVNNQERDIGLRLQGEDGGFGPEFSLRISQKSPMIHSLKQAESDSFVGLGDKDGELRFFKLGNRELQKEDVAELQPQILHPPIDNASTLLTLLADLTEGDANGDDIVTVDTMGAGIYVYNRLPSGALGAGTMYPCLKNVSSVGRLRMPGESLDRIVLCSAREKMVGISEYKDGRLTFPQQLPLKTEPFLAQPIQIGDNACRDILVATRDGRRFNIETLHYDVETKQWKSNILKLGSIVRDPTDMIVRDLNNDGLEDALIMFPREPIRIILQQPDGTLVEACEDSAIRKGQLENLSSSELGFGDFDGDGQEDILVAQTGFIRAYHLSGDQELSLIDQANTRTATDLVSIPLLVDIEKTGTPELLVYDKANASLQILQKEGTLYKYLRSIPLGKMDTRMMLHSGTDDSSRLLVAGARQIWNIPISGPQWLADIQASCSSKVKDAHYYSITTGDLNNDGVEEVVAIDAANHGIEVFTQKKNGEPLSIASFVVYSDERLSSGSPRGQRGYKNSEPREALVSDLTNDTLSDLILLCHDRLLLYPQFK